MPTLLVPDSVGWTLPPLPLEVKRFPARGPVPPDALEADALLAWGVPRSVLGELFRDMPRLRWIQTLSAGVEHLLSVGPPPRARLCNGRGLHDAPVAEHVLAMLLAGVRGLPFFRDAQRERRWAQDVYWSVNRGATERAARLETLEGARAVIVGMGSIGAAIAERLRPFGVSVSGVARSAGERAGVPVRALEDLDALLPDADVLVLVLPDTPDTRGLLSRERLERLPAHAWVVNVGRGSAIDEVALADALAAGRLGGAALDVFAREPLPEDSPLWALPNVIVSPHVAGGGPGFERRALALLARNAAHFAAGEPLENVVDVERGY